MSTTKLERPAYRPADTDGVPLDIARIKALRIKLGLSQDEAARRSGVSGRQEWNKIEGGHRSNITLDTLERIAHALGVPAKELLK
ncbi:MAG TPA: helix-turn-helix transcriptional regulator [Tepidisphaeraceae bacterium]|jgi:transcriptional regulator with XRE-family HTH domain